MSFRPSQSIAAARARWNWHAGMAPIKANRDFDVEARSLAERRRREAEPLPDDSGYIAANTLGRRL